VTKQIKCAGEKKVRNKKKWRERMAGAKHDKMVTKPNLHDIKSRKRMAGAKKTITLNLN
jgi:hypothetical protein